MMLQTSSPAAQQESTIIAFLIEYTEVLYGLRVENLSVSLWNAAFTAICERWPTIQVHDIQNAYRYATIEKRQFTTLTRDELIAPINDYWMKKMALDREIEAMKEKEQAEIDGLNKAREFKEQAKLKYIACLENGIWTGDEFEAMAIAPNFKDVIKQEQKNEFVRLAKEEYYKRTEAIKDNQYGIVPGWTYIYARIFIEECLRIRYKYIQE